MSVGLVDAGEIDTRQEKHSWGHIRVLFAAVDLEAVNPVLVDRLDAGQNGYQKVITIFQYHGATSLCSII